jgi:hypothetical protein
MQKKHGVIFNLMGGVHGPWSNSELIGGSIRASERHTIV